jgi:hypothetical protein
VESWQARFPFLVQQLATSTAHPNTGSLCLPLCVFVAFPAMKACVTEDRISVPCTKQHGTRLPRPSPPSHLRVAAAPRRFYSPLLILFSPSKVESARPLRFHLHTTPFPRIQHPIARSRLAGHWRVIPHLLVLRRIISSSTLDILLTRPCIEPYSIAHIFPSSSLCQDVLACPLPSSKHTVSLFLSQENCRAL